MRYFLFFILFFQHSFGQKDSLVDFGQRLIYENKHAEAIDYFNKQLIATKDSNNRAVFLLEIAEVYKLQLDFSKASSYYIKAFEEIKKKNNYQLEFLYYVKMAEFYRKRALHEQAVVELDKAKILLKKYPINDANLAKYYSRKAAVFNEYYSMPDSTIAYAKKSLIYATKDNDKDNIFYSKLEIASIYDEKNNYKKAIEGYKELIVYAEKNNLIQHRADVYINYTRTLVKDQQLDKALNESLKALELAKKYNLLYNEILVSIDIYNLYKGMNNLKEANKYLEYRLELSEKYYKLEHNKYLFELEEKYKVAEKEKQIEINKLELSNKDKKLANNRISFYIIFGLFVIVILIAVLIAYFLKKSKSTNKRLQFLSQQNEFLLSEANHRINNNLQLIIILITVQLDKIPENEGQEIRKILKKINSIATLHRHLYQSDDRRHVDSYKYLKDIQISFADLFSEHGIATHFEIESIELSADVSMYLGLLLTELCINSIKYAFLDQEDKEIRFELKQDKGSFCFSYSDNGVGFSSVDVKPKLIDQLCRQLRVQYQIDADRGFHFSFEKSIS